MAQTDARAGFRLPWNSERSNIEQTETDEIGGEHATEPAAGGWPTEEAPMATDTPTATETPADEAGTDAVGWSANGHTAATPTMPTPPARNKPSKFLADLTKAMSTAAEDARTRTLSQFQGEAKAYVEQIHARSATEATELRRKADDDVAAVREWSKAEIARIREETETKITARKGQLETEIEGHTGLIEREIAQVQARVGEFENEMAAFFERLFAEEDPTHFATMAENLPEPPPFEAMGLGDWEPESAAAEAVADETVEAVAETAVDEAVAPEGEVEAVAEGEATAETEEAGEAEAVVETTEETVGDAETETVTTDGMTGTGTGDGGGFEIDREAAFAAIQAAAEAAASAEVATDAAERAEAVADIAMDIVGSRDHEGDSENDPRVDALGLTPDFDAAEAEAAASADDTNTDEIPEIGDDALAARLAGLVPGRSGDKAKSGDAKSTQVIVTGLVSVASIASFKRHLGRMPGVQAVGVSSGPDGEFLFAVTHAADIVLRDTIPGIPSFQARVTAAGEGTLNVTAHDPESDH